MKKPLLFDMTSPYSKFESWVYDRYIAPALLKFIGVLEDDLIGGLNEGDRLLDVGCGGGQQLRYLAEKRLGVDLYGLDLSLDQIQRTKERTKAYSNQVFSIRGTALELPFKNNSFNHVMSVASVKHWPEPKRGLLECVRILKPGGNLFIVEASKDCTLEDSRRFVSEFQIPGFLKGIVARAFQKFVAGQGLSNREAQTLVTNLHCSQIDIRKIEGLPAIRIRAEK